MLQSETVKKYDTYKDSGIEWIGEIPQDWGLTRLKQHYQFEKGKDAALYTNEYIGFNEGDYPVYSGQTENNGIMGKVNNYDYDEPICVFTTTVGAKVMSPKILSGKFCLSQNCLIMKKFGTIDERFLYYQLLPLFDYEKSLIPSYMQPSLRISDLKRYVIISCDEQQKIADYLDKKCGEIDRVIETEKLVIEKLKEYKQSIITEAVTKGLDKSVPLKDSGIKWIGKIPQHWKIIKLKKTISLIADIDHYMPDTTDTGYSYLMTGDLKDIASKIDFENCKHISDSDYKDLSKKIHPVLDDVIFARYATIGTVCYVDIQKDFLVSYSCLTIRPNSEKLFGKFLYYYLISDTFKIEVSQYINSNTQSNVGLDSLQKVYMVLPNKTEQQQIAEYLDKKCSEIDKAIANKEQVIEKFTEYKKSLIYECVTGKKRVA